VTTVYYFYATKRKYSRMRVRIMWQQTM